MPRTGELQDNNQFSLLLGFIYTGQKLPPSPLHSRFNFAGYEKNYKVNINLMLYFQSVKIFRQVGKPLANKASSIGALKVLASNVVNPFSFLGTMTTGAGAENSGLPAGMLGSSKTATGSQNLDGEAFFALFEAVRGDISAANALSKTPLQETADFHFQAGIFHVSDQQISDASERLLARAGNRGVFPEPLTFDPSFFEGQSHVNTLTEAGKILVQPTDSVLATTPSLNPLKTDEVASELLPSGADTESESPSFLQILAQLSSRTDGADDVLSEALGNISSDEESTQGDFSEFLVGLSALAAAFSGSAQQSATDALGPASTLASSIDDGTAQPRSELSDGKITIAPVKDGRSHSPALGNPLGEQAVNGAANPGAGQSGPASPMLRDAPLPADALPRVSSGNEVGTRQDNVIAAGDDAGRAHSVLPKGEPDEPSLISAMRSGSVQSSEAKGGLSNLAQTPPGENGAAQRIVPTADMSVARPAPQPELGTLNTGLAELTADASQPETPSVILPKTPAQPAAEQLVSAAQPGIKNQPRGANSPSLPGPQSLNARAANQAGMKEQEALTSQIASEGESAVDPGEVDPGMAQKPKPAGTATSTIHATGTTTTITRPDGGPVMNATPLAASHAIAQAANDDPMDLGLDGGEATEMLAEHSRGTNQKGDATAPSRAFSASPNAAIATSIAKNVQNGNTRFQIRLDPPELGRVDVRLNIDSDGNVTAKLVVERSETMEMLMRDNRVLEQALRDAGVKLGGNDAISYSLSNSGRDQGSSFANLFGGEGGSGRGDDKGEQTNDPLEADNDGAAEPQEYTPLGLVNLVV